MSTLLASGIKGVTFFFASTYGSGTYDGSTYNGQYSSTASSAGGSLTNTGLDVALIITIACVIALSAIIVRVWRRPKHNISSD